MDEIQIDGDVQLGEGGNGSVFRGTFGDRKVAVKIILRTNATDNEEALKLLDHQNVVKLYNVQSTVDTKRFALELCEASLDQVFLGPDDPRKYKGPKLPYHFEILSQLASGLEYIHSKNLIHRDIKPANVLISVDSTGQDAKKVTMKWADFGLSRIVNERGSYAMSGGVKGTKYWYSPELLEQIDFFNPRSRMGEPLRVTVKSDVFSLGLVFGYLLLDGQHLYGSAIDNQIHQNIKKGKILNIKEILTGHYARDLLPKMLTNKPEDRISSEGILEQLKLIKIELEDKEIEMCHLCSVASTPIHWTNLTEKLKILIQEGVNVNGKDEDGNNALYLLCRFNSSEQLTDGIKLLIQLGIDVNEKDKDGDNALHLLCQFNSSERLTDGIKLLIQLGIDVNGKGNNGFNALYLLCCNNSSERLTDGIKLLIQLGIDVNGICNNRFNALHLLCCNNSSERLTDGIKLLIQLGIDVNEKTNNGANALHLLCCNNSSERLTDGIKLLIQLGIHVNEKNNEGYNALHELCRFNSSERLTDGIKLLIQLGIDVNGKGNNGFNALHLLCCNNSSERLTDGIELLIELGVDVTSNGIDARQILRQNSNPENLDEIIELLDGASLS